MARAYPSANPYDAAPNQQFYEATPHQNIGAFQHTPSPVPAEFSQSVQNVVQNPYQNAQQLPPQAPLQYDPSMNSFDHSYLEQHQHMYQQQSTYDTPATYQPTQQQFAPQNVAAAAYPQAIMQHPNQRHQQYGNPMPSPSQNQQMQTQQQMQPQQQYYEQPQQPYQQYPSQYVAPAEHQQMAPTAPVSTGRIDPKQIPRPMYPSNAGDVIKFFTRSGVCPPPSSSQFSVIDEGNCSPRFVRLTTNHIPSTNDLVDAAHICVGAVIQPLANVGKDEDMVSVVDLGPGGPLRCSRCRAYINPFFRFVDGGRFFVCNMCELKNEVPREYQCHLDANGFRRDRNDRPELCRGSVEFTAPAEYTTRTVQQEPCYLFVIDVSYSAVVTGLTRVLLQAIRNCLDGLLATQPRARVGLLTYDAQLHFYRLCGRGVSTVQLVQVADVAAPFTPMPPSELLVSLAQPEMRSAFEAALLLVDRMFSDTRQEGNAMGAACQAAIDLLV